MAAGDLRGLRAHGRAASQRAWSADGPAGAAGTRQRLSIVAAALAGLAFAAVTVLVDRAGGGPGDGASGWYGSHLSAMYLLSDVIGLSFLAAGVVAWWQRPPNLVGRLMVAAGTLWFASNLQASADPVLNALGFWLTYLPPVIAGHLALAYPTGHLRNRVERFGVAASYLSYLVLQGVRYVVEGPAPRIGVPTDTPNSTWASIIGLDAFVFTVAILVLIYLRWARASAPARRVHGPVWFICALMSGLVVVSVIGAALHAPVPVISGLVMTYGACLIALPFAFLSGVLRLRMARQRVADLVLALERAPGPEGLRDLLAQTIGDPRLVLGFWAPGPGCYVDGQGQPVAIPENGVTYVERHGQRLAVLVHDVTLTRQPVVQAAAAATRLALENAQLHALLRAQLAQLHASRTRLVETALAERRKIERDLHDGLQHRLLRLSWLAERAGTTELAAELATEARDAYTTLRELARGIHPAVLTERGLRAAVEEHALRCPVPVEVELPARRWPERVEATVYFVILEAVTNATKHADASRISIRGWPGDGTLTVEIADDGRGGAQPQGHGLRGLSDRVAALDGQLTVHSPPGRGTRIVMELPCA